MPTTVTLNHTGADQYLLIPAGVTSLTIDLRAAKGGGSPGGNGARVQATIPVTPGESLTVRVPNQPVGSAGGWPNAGAGTGSGWGGGGACELLRGATLLASAGGGGGAAGSIAGGAGGLTGGTASSSDGGVSQAEGTGGTQTAGGATGGAYRQGGSGLATPSGNGGGGGGLYGGGGGRGEDQGGGPVAEGGGGGGSSLVPSGGSVTAGFTAGNGSALLTYNRAPATPTVTSPNGGETFDAVHPITWSGGADPDGDAVVFDVELSTDGRVTWQRIGTGIVVGAPWTYDFSGQPSSTACRIRIRSRDGSGAVSAWDESNANFTIQHNQPPNAPTLLEPANGATVNLAGTPRFRAAPNDPNNDQQSGYRFRRKLTSASAYEYWNAGTAAWQSTPVTNSLQGATQVDLVFPAGRWDSLAYNWSAATVDSLGEIGPFAADRTVTGSVPGSVTVTEPIGPVTLTSQPVVKWSLSDPEGDPQQTYEVAIASAAQYTAPGFDPATSAVVDRKAPTSSSTVRDWQGSVSLPDDTTYRAYVRVTSGNIETDWAFSEFTTNLDSPAPPLLTATVDNDSGVVELVATRTDDPEVFTDAVVIFEFSIDGGDTWQLVRGAERVIAPSTDPVAVYDWETPPGVLVGYRARVQAVL